MEENKSGTQYYTDEERMVVEEHIETFFGRIEGVFHEISSPDIHVDICVIPPVKGRHYYTLVTMGMGARTMRVPAELADRRLERAELAMALPPDWEINGEDEKWYWPFRLLKVLARLPIEMDTWLGWGHSMDCQEPFAENTELSAVLLAEAQGEEGCETMLLPNGETVNFYQVLPVYPEELEEKAAYGAEYLLAGMRKMGFVVSLDRPRVVLSEEDLNEFYGELVMDDMQWHLDSLLEKELPVEEITACSHLAIYLRWCIEKGLMCEDFLEAHADMADRVKNASAFVDLRPFVQEELEGVLKMRYFNEEGRGFAGYYYADNGEHYFPADIDDHALAYFGEEGYNSEEFQDEAYLFVPFDEAYYQAMAKIMEERWEQWQKEEGRK